MKEFHFTVFIEKNGGCNVAHCLEMGLVAVNPDPDEVLAVMGKLIVRQLQFALENDNPADIYHSAPADVWTRFRAFMAEHREPETRSKKTVSVEGWPTVLCNQSTYTPTSTAIPAFA